MRNLIITIASTGIVLVGVTHVLAQAPPKGTDRATCKVNPDWRWIGTQKKGKCFRKAKKVLKDLQEQEAQKAGRGQKK